MARKNVHRLGYQEHKRWSAQSSASCRDSRSPPLLLTSSLPPLAPRAHHLLRPCQPLWLPAARPAHGRWPRTCDPARIANVCAPALSAACTPRPRPGPGPRSGNPSERAHVAIARARACCCAPRLRSSFPWPPMAHSLHTAPLPALPFPLSSLPVYAPFTRARRPRCH
jgi:hypothetical protein